jgi:hypothetical protein
LDKRKTRSKERKETRKRGIPESRTTERWEEEEAKGRGTTYIGGVADELPEEDLLVAVEGVDDEAEELVDLGLEGEGFGFGGHGSERSGGSNEQTKEKEGEASGIDEEACGAGAGGMK